MPPGGDDSYLHEADSDGRMRPPFAEGVATDLLAFMLTHLTANTRIKHSHGLEPAVRHIGRGMVAAKAEATVRV